LTSLVFIIATTMLLMWPAAYHRIVEGGEDSERFHRFASWTLVVALATLAAGLSVDLFVVVDIVSGSMIASTTVGATCLVAFYGVWYAFTLMRRHNGRPVTPLSSVRQATRGVSKAGDPNQKGVSDG
jgi:hypothetical protein